MLNKRDFLSFFRTDEFESGEIRFRATFSASNSYKKHGVKRGWHVKPGISYNVLTSTVRHATSAAKYVPVLQHKGSM